MNVTFFTGSWICTVMDALTVSSASQVQVIVQSPTALPLIRPFLSTVAMRSSDEVQMTFLLSVFFGSTVALQVLVFPISIVSSSAERVTLSGFCTTLMLKFARTLLPSAAVAMIRPFPRLMPVTVPFWSTVTIRSSPEDQITSLIVAFSGSAFELTVTCWPTITAGSEASTRIFLTGCTTSIR